MILDSPFFYVNGNYLFRVVLKYSVKNIFTTCFKLKHNKKQVTENQIFNHKLLL